MQNCTVMRQVEEGGAGNAMCTKANEAGVIFSHADADADADTDADVDVDVDVDTFGTNISSTHSSKYVPAVFWFNRYSD